MTSSEQVANAVRKYWKENNYAFDVVVLFQQKYSWEDSYELHEEIIEAVSDTELEIVEILNDFDEGQDCVKIEKIVPLSEVLELARKAYEVCNNT